MALPGLWAIGVKPRGCGLRLGANEGEGEGEREGE